MNTKTNTTVLDAEVVSVKSVETPSEAPVKIMDAEGNVNLSALTVADKERYGNLSKSLNVTDINSISNYGAELQGTMTKYSTEFLQAVRTAQGGEIGTLINNLLSELDYIDVDELKEPSKLKKFIRKIPILNKAVASVDKVLRKYDNISTNVDNISQKISVTRLSALRDNNALQTMFENNVIYAQQVEELIIAGKLKLQEVNSTLENMMANADEYEAHEIQDMQEFSYNLERRLSDMTTLHYVVKQSLPQIRTVQYNNLAIANKAQSIIATTIPVWKNQLSIAVALHNQKSNIEAHRKVTETTNLMLRKNAEILQQNSIDVARENERSIVDIETLRDTTRKLIETVQEVKKVHEEGVLKRRAAEVEIRKIESDLEASMTSLASGSSMPLLQ